MQYAKEFTGLILSNIVSHVSYEEKEPCIIQNLNDTMDYMRQLKLKIFGQPVKVETEVSLDGDLIKSIEYFGGDSEIQSTNR